MEEKKEEKGQGEGGEGAVKEDKDNYAFLPGDVIQPYTKPFVKVLYCGERRKKEFENYIILIDYII
jgi:hypothetical protein